MLNISFFIAAFSSIFWLIYSLNFIYAPLPNMEQLYRSVLIIALPIILIWGLFITIRSYYAAQNASARTFAILEQLKKQTENMETLGCALLSAEKEIKNGFILREFDTLIADANEILADIIKRSNSISSAQMEHLWSRTAGGERWLIAKTFIETYNFQSGFTEHLLQRAQKDPLLKGSILEFQARIKGLYRLMEVYDTQRIFYNIIASGALGRTYELITPIAEKLTQAKNIEEKPKRKTANVQPSVTTANGKIYTLTEEQDISFPSFLTRPANTPHSALYAINKIHNTSWELAHLYLGEKDNRLAAQASIDVPENGLDTEVFRYFVVSTCGMLDDNFNKIMSVAFGQGTENAPEEEADAEEGGEETSE